MSPPSPWDRSGLTEPGERWQFRGGDGEERRLREQRWPLRTSEALRAVKTSAPRPISGLQGRPQFSKLGWKECPARYRCSPHSERYSGDLELPRRPLVRASFARPPQTPTGAPGADELRPGPGAHHDRSGLRVPCGDQGLPAVHQGRCGWPRDPRGKQQPGEAALFQPQPSFGLTRAKSGAPPGLKGLRARKLGLGLHQLQPPFSLPSPPTALALSPPPPP